jgi:3',5'-cyclic AMP phosphodiesterase CpdA
MTERTERRPALRVAHVTDIHVVEGNRAPQGWAAALEAVAALDPPAAFLVTGGDHIGDALEKTDPALVRRQWDLYQAGLARHNALPVRPVMGNHDVWGWMVPALDPATPGYGKAMALERLGLERSYYSFDQGAWHFIVLDNIQKEGAMYAGDLDEPQRRWLEADLLANTKPVCLFSHIPLLSICAFHARGHLREDHWRIPYAWVHRDVMPLVQLLRRHGVRVCLSGHLHMVDRVEFLGVTFICNGSVCGRWWNGPYQEFAEGFGVLDLYEDGTFDYAYRPYGWIAGAVGAPVTPGPAPRDG